MVEAAGFPRRPLQKPLCSAPRTAIRSARGCRHCRHRGDRCAGQPAASAVPLTCCGRSRGCRAGGGELSWAPQPPQQHGRRRQGSRCAASVPTQVRPLRWGRSAELRPASRALPRGRGGRSHALLPLKTTFVTSKQTVTPAPSSPQGCGFAQQLDRHWTTCARGPQPSLPLTGAGALAPPVCGLWPSVAGARGRLQPKEKLGEALIWGESCWLLPLPLVPLLKLRARDRALSEAEVGSPLRGEKRQPQPPASDGTGTERGPILLLWVPHLGVLRAATEPLSPSGAERCTARCSLGAAASHCSPKSLTPTPDLPAALPGQAGERAEEKQKRGRPSAGGRSLPRLPGWRTPARSTAHPPRAPLPPEGTDLSAGHATPRGRAPAPAMRGSQRAAGDSLCAHPSGLTGLPGAPERERCRALTRCSWEGCGRPSSARSRRRPSCRARASASRPAGC